MKYGALAKEREVACTWIKEIEDREILATSEEKKKEEEIRKEMEKQDADRREVRQERREEAGKLV